MVSCTGGTHTGGQGELHRWHTGGQKTHLGTEGRPNETTRSSLIPLQTQVHNTALIWSSLTMAHSLFKLYNVWNLCSTLNQVVMTLKSIQPHRRTNPTSSSWLLTLFIIPRASLWCSSWWLSPEGPAIWFCLQRMVSSAQGCMSSTALALLAAMQMLPSWEKL